MPRCLAHPRVRSAKIELAWIRRGASAVSVDPIQGNSSREDDQKHGAFLNCLSLLAVSRSMLDARTGIGYIVLAPRNTLASRVYFCCFDKCWRTTACCFNVSASIKSFCSVGIDWSARRGRPRCGRWQLACVYWLPDSKDTGP